jgi:hypothetical protein
VLDPGGRRLLACYIGNHRLHRIELAGGIVETIGGTGDRQPTPDGAPL